jgi:hypothetical protein
MPALAPPAEETRLPGLNADGLPGLAPFRAAHPGYTSALRAPEYGYVDAEGQVYLDYTGAGLSARAQLTAHAALLHGRLTFAASTALIDWPRYRD